MFDHSDATFRFKPTSDRIPKRAPAKVFHPAVALFQIRV